jgi:hypothetical protein
VVRNLHRERRCDRKSKMTGVHSHECCSFCADPSLIMKQAIKPEAEVTGAQNEIEAGMVSSMTPHAN